MSGLVPRGHHSRNSDISRACYPPLGLLVLGNRVRPRSLPPDTPITVERVQNGTPLHGNPRPFLDNVFRWETGMHFPLPARHATTGQLRF